MIRLLPATLLALLAALPAHARCYSADDLQGGLMAQAQNGSRWLFSALLGSDGVSGAGTGGAPAAPLAGFTQSNGWLVSDVSESLARRIAPPETLADKRAVFARLHFTRGVPTDAAPGTSWENGVTIEVTATTQNWGTEVVAKLPAHATIRFLPEGTGKISGCSYRIAPIEMQVVAKDGAMLIKRRMIRFPDLGFAMVTRWGPDAEGPEVQQGITGFAYPD